MVQPESVFEQLDFRLNHCGYTLLNETADPRRLLGKSIAKRGAAGAASSSGKAINERDRW